ncbi:MAG: hypothetical protein ACK5MD_05970, partial [Flavobacteriales bacterium]
MKNNQLILGILLLFFLSSCKNDKEYYFDEPLKEHYTFLGLNKNVKSVTYEKQIFEITDGGYFPNDKGNNDVIALMQYPYQSNELNYMANINSSLIFNYPITGNQYLINELQLNESINSKNIKIELENGRITSYSNQDDKNRDYKLTCSYNENGDLYQLIVKSEYPKTVNFKYKGNFIEQIIEKRKEKIDTINFVFESKSKDEISIKRKDKNITVYLNRTPDKTILEKIVYENDNQTFEFENNRLVLNSKVKSDGNYDTYYKLEYQENQLKKILNSNSYSKNTVVYDLNTDLLISAINVETDKEKMKNIGLTFDYKQNNRNDWTEMSYYVDRRYYDEAK